MALVMFIESSDSGSYVKSESWYSAVKSEKGWGQGMEGGGQSVEGVCEWWSRVGGV